MIKTFNELINYLKYPILKEDQHLNANYRLQKFFHVLIISILTSTLLMPIFGFIEAFGLIDMKQHAMKELTENFSKSTIFFLAVVMAPIVEELIFRAPLTLFKNKNTFKVFFYVFAILFGIVHLSNFTITKNVILLAPLLVAPQIILGGYLGFIRIRFGLLWSIALHASYNTFFILLSFAGDSFQ